MHYCRNSRGSEQELINKQILNLNRKQKLFESKNLKNRNFAAKNWRLSWKRWRKKRDRGEKKGKKHHSEEGTSQKTSDLKRKFGQEKIFRECEKRKILKLANHPHPDVNFKRKKLQP